MEPSGTCVAQALGTEGRFDVAELLAGYGPPDPRWVYYSIFTGNYADVVGDGLSIGVQTGMTSEGDSCVPHQNPPSAARVPRSSILEAEPSPGGFPFDASVGISESFLEHTLWGVYNSGALCIEITSATVPQLSTGTLGIFMQSLSNLTDGSAPVLIKFAPKQAPTVSIGRHVVEQDPNTGEYILTEPLLVIELNNIDIDLYAFIFDRYARILTINSDIHLPLGLTLTPSNELIPVLGDLSNALQNVEVRNSELISEDPALIAGLLPSLISGFLPQLAGSISNPIQLPDLMGFQLNVEEMTGIENNTMIGLFAGLAYVPPGGLAGSAETQAMVDSIEMPASHFLDANGNIDWAHAGSPSGLVPTVNLLLSGRSPLPGQALEYSVRVDDSLWSIFSPVERLPLRHPALLLPGPHTLQVRSRVIGDYHTLDPSPESLDVTIDWRAPIIEAIQRDDAAIRVMAYDQTSAATELSYRIRVNGGEWSSWTGSNLFELSAHRGSRVRLEAQVRDGNGNVATLKQSLTVEGAVEAASDTDGACSCSTTRRSSSMPTGLSLLLVALGLLAVRRRRWSLFAALVCSGVVLFSCEDSPKSEFIPCGGCSEGNTCIDEQCVPDSACDGPADCQPGQLCEDTNGDGFKECRTATCEQSSDCSLSCGAGEMALCFEGICSCGVPCSDGCPTGQFCCNAENSCLPIPDQCGELTCEPGFRIEMQSPGGGDPTTCDITDPVCTCVELPPLRMGRYGQYTNIGANVGGVVAASAYNDTYGDLMLGLKDASGQMTWSFIDGLPIGAPVEGSTSGPRGGIKAPGADRGRYTDLAVAADGTLHISYQDVDNEDLMYARGVATGGSYSWTFTTVDAAGRSGLWTSLSLDSTGAPGISYMVAEVLDPADGLVYSELRYAQASTATPASGSDFAVVTVDRLNVTGPCATPCATGSFCRLDNSQCEAPVADSVCGSGCASEERCFGAGTCAVVVDPAALVDWQPGVGLHSAQARYSDGRVALAYYDSANGDLRFAKQSAGGAFDAPVVLSGADGNSGLWPSIAIDGSDVEHLSFVDWSHKDLRYLALDGSSEEVVDDGTRIDAFGPSINFIGDDSSILLYQGLPTIAYQDSSTLQLVLAQKDASGVFVQTVLSGEGRGTSYTGAYGFYADHVIVGDTAFLINFVIDQQASPTNLSPIFQVTPIP